MTAPTLTLIQGSSSRVDLARLRDIPDSIEAEYADCMDWRYHLLYLYDPAIRPELGSHFGHGQEEGGDRDDQQAANDGSSHYFLKGEIMDLCSAPPRPSQEQLEAARRHYPGGGIWDQWNGGRVEGEDQGDESEAGQTSARSWQW